MLGTFLMQEEKTTFLRILLDPIKGSLHLPELAVVIGKDLSQASAREMLGAFHRKDRDRDFGNGYSWLFLQNLSLEGMPCAIGLCFHQDALTELDFGVSLPSDRFEDGWFTRETIDNQIAFMRKAFQTQLGKKFGNNIRHFKWGTAWVGFDEKGFQASAGLRYT